MNNTATDLVSRWKNGVKVHPVSPDRDGHTIHTYFNTCPESPDGRYVLFFRSLAADGQFGDICILERATGKERILVKDVHTEDAHRVAAQQWVSNGKRVAFQDERDGQWLTAVVDVESGEQRVLARGRLVGFGQPTGDLVPLYGPHWNPGEHRDLEFANVATGEITTAVTNAAVRKEYPEYIAKSFKSAPTSIFFPILSPNGKRVFFKMSAVVSGDPTSATASTREGMVVYDLEKGRLIRQLDFWGHPSWCPDSRTLVEVMNVKVDLETGRVEKIPGLPHFSGSHPSVSRDGQLYLTDAHKFDGKESEWGVVVADLNGDNYFVLHRFSMAGGAKSWRRPHPHPVFSADGQRIYFNTGAKEWTQLYYAESKGSDAID